MAPELIDPEAKMEGTERNVGASVLHVCKTNPSVTFRSVCGDDGQWSSSSFTCPQSKHTITLNLF